MIDSELGSIVPLNVLLLMPFVFILISRILLHKIWWIDALKSFLFDVLIIVFVLLTSQYLYLDFLFTFIVSVILITLMKEYIFHKKLSFKFFISEILSIIIGIGIVWMFLSIELYIKTGYFL